MAYTASVLSFMLRGISIPVVLTGAQLPMAHPLSDGMENLRTALAMAASGVPGVFLAFDRKVILAAGRSRPAPPTSMPLRASTGPWPPMWTARGCRSTGRPSPPPPEPAPCGDKLCDKVFLIKLTPGLDPEIFDMLLQMHYRGIVLETFAPAGCTFSAGTCWTGWASSLPTGCRWWRAASAL